MISLRPRGVCAFCDIVRGREVTTETVISFPPLYPVAQGHVLFVPTLHVEDAVNIPLLTGEVFEEASHYAKEQGIPFNLITSSGSAATQTVFHLHVHYIPRSPNDGLLLPWSGQQAGGKP